MSGTLQIVALAALACLATFLLERGGRSGYGWITGSEFVVAGLVVGPVGLDLISADLVAQAQPVIALAIAWLGLRFGLRLRRAELRPLPWRHLLASQLEPLLTLLALRGLLWAADRYGQAGFGGLGGWAFAAVGAATTKSAVAWARTRHGARGPTVEALATISALDDLVSVAGVAAVYAWARPVASELPAGAWAPGLATLGLGLGLGALVLLVIGRSHFRADLTWLALFGACALGAGLAGQLGVCALAVMALAGAAVAWGSPHAESLEAITQPTERPTVQVLLVLAGASAPAELAPWTLGLTYAGLRLLAKLVGGFAGGLVAGAGPAAGAGLWAGGGVAFALAYGLAQSLPRANGPALLAGACAMVVAGDLLGSPALKALLRRRGEITEPTPGPMPAAEGAP